MKIAICLFIVLCLPALIYANNAQRVAKVEITGNERIDTAFISNSVKTKEGDSYDLDKIREDMKSIYRTGFFSDVQIDVKDSDKGKVITFVVIERPPIKSILVSGNKKVKTDDLVDKLKIKTGTVLNTEKVKESMDEIRKFYAGKGYYATKVTYEIDYSEKYDATVNFVIEEPVQAYVKKISFTGNKAFKDSTLKGYMSTKEKGIFSWFTGSGILDEDALVEDRKNVETFYQDNGYTKIQVGVPDITLSKDGKSISISMTVDEGPIHRVGAIEFAGDLIFPKEDLLKALKTRSGDVFRITRFYEDVMKITDMYQDKGFAFCEVTPLTAIDDSANKVNVTFNMAKNQEVFFNRINIVGNKRTRDKVVRRELKFAEGDRFSITNIKDSKKKLKNTTFFKDTDFKVVKTDDPKKVNVDLTIEEKPTGTFTVGAGYSTSEKVIASGSISEENFLGTGRRLSLEAALSSYTTEFRFSYLEPYIFDKNISAGFTAFNFKRIMDTYDYKKTGGYGTLIKPLTDDIKATLRYRLENIDVSDVESYASTYIKQQEGVSLTSSLTFALQKNSIDDILNPTKGVNAGISIEAAGGPLGGDNYFVAFNVFYGRYIPIKFLDSSFFLKGTYGTIGGYSGREVPITEKFYVGGLNSIRGFRYGEAGPMDENDEPVGAKNQLFFNLEWIFPIYKPAGVKGVIFTDTGAGFDDWNNLRMRTSAGLGIRWFSPLGPIRLELGFNLNPKDNERKSLFDFAIGTQY
ncbi:MAG TPA: outer membrane protein assembly factor BamA [Syntrophorhabdaceae bacterium]|nr:outer membrane protein assembly factor BamA [Syntrophorhabdaceae bacterium]